MLNVFDPKIGTSRIKRVMWDTYSHIPVCTSLGRVWKIFQNHRDFGAQICRCKLLSKLGLVNIGQFLVYTWFTPGENEMGEDSALIDASAESRTNVPGDAQPIDP